MKNFVIVRLENVIVNVRSAEERFEKWLNEEVGMNEAKELLVRLTSEEHGLEKKKEVRKKKIDNWLKEIEKLRDEKEEKKLKYENEIDDQEELEVKLEKLERNYNKRIAGRVKKINDTDQDILTIDKIIEEINVEKKKILSPKEEEKIALSKTREAQLRLKWFKEDFEREFVSKTCNPGIKETFRELGKLRVNIALVTNYRMPLVKPLLKRLNMEYEVADGRKENWLEDLLKEYEVEADDALLVRNQPDDLELSNQINVVTFAELQDSIGLNKPKQLESSSSAEDDHEEINEVDFAELQDSIGLNKPEQPESLSSAEDDYEENDEERFGEKPYEHYIEVAWTRRKTYPVYSDRFMELVEEGEKLDWRVAFNELIQAYINMCGFSLGYRTLYYNAAEGWQEKLKGRNSPVPLNKPICDYFPQLCEAYDPALYDEYDITIIKGDDFAIYATQLINEIDNEENHQLCIAFCAGIKFFLDVLPL